jgi:deoxyribodipyrimidine photolyase
MSNKTLVWITNSFRKDSRLTNQLSELCTFVYYSPYYFAGERERKIYERCSQQNLNAFYHSLHSFDTELKQQGHQGLLVFKESDPIEHINRLCEKWKFDNVVIDQPLFAMWHTIDLLRLNVPYEIIDSALIDDTCFKMTAKSRWMTHVKNASISKPHQWNSNIAPYFIKESSRTYPIPKHITPLLNTDEVIERAKYIAPTYGTTRDSHNGQTRLSTLLQNGMADPHNIFFEIAKQFQESGSDLSINEGSHASMLRQFAFREINIITARRNNLTMEDSPEQWARTIMHHKSYDNLIDSIPKPESNLSFDSIKSANTGIEELDKILLSFTRTGIMPNRARMYFAGKIFYESKSGIDALNLLIDTFDLIGLDGQCPNNYIQCISSMNLTYGKVMLMSAKRTFDLLSYPM